MDNEINKTITMQGGSDVIINENIGNLLNTRDIELYLDMLASLKESFLIILSVKDNPGIRMPEKVLLRIHSLGFANFSKNTFEMYIGVIDRGNVVFDKRGEKAGDAVEYNGQVADLEISSVSKAWKEGNLSEIKVDDINYSLNCRGVNLVVYDYKSKAVIDSIAYDSHTEYPTLYHKNLKFDEKYFDEHFFVLEKYQEIWREPFRKRYYSNRKLNVIEVENAIILPNKNIGNRVYGGVCDERFNFIAGHQTHNAEAGLGSRHISGSYSVSDSEIQYKEETVLYGGSIIDAIGHQIVECFADRLWWLVKNHNTNVKVAVINLWGSGSRFTNEMLNLLGVSDDRIITITKPTKFKKVIIPDQSSIPLFWHHRIYDFTNEYSMTFKHLCSSIEPAEFKKIYFTKSQTQRANIIGEKYFIDFYKNRGFKIIDPEDYTIREKISLMLGADEFVSIAGTNNLYSIFCKSSAKITILSRTKNNPLPCNLIAFDSQNISNIYCVDVSGNFLHNDLIDGIALVYVTEEFKKYVKHEFNEELEITPEESLKQNIYDYLSYFPEYYANLNGILGKSRFYNSIKNQKMLTVLQLISEVFCGREFDTSGLDLTTNEDILKEQVRQLNNDLNISQKRVLELQNTDICKTANALELSNTMLNKQVVELKNTIDRNSEKLNQMQEVARNEEKLQSELKIVNMKNLELLEEKHALEKFMIIFSEEQKNKICELENNLKKVLAEKTDIMLKAQLNEEKLQNLTAEYEQFNLKLNSDMARLSMDLTEARLSEEKLMHQIAAYEQSSSWKITKPMRSIAWFFRRLFGKTK